MLRRLNGTAEPCGMDETERKEMLNAAIGRARANTPFLRLQLDRFPSVAEALCAGRLDAAIALAKGEGSGEAPLAALLRHERGALAAALAIGDLAGLLSLEGLMAELSGHADRSLDRAIAVAIAERTPAQPAQGFAVI